MKPKSKKQKARRLKEFRFHKVEVLTTKKTNVIRHPAYVFLEQGNIYIYVILTHSSNVNNSIVIKLKKNPNPKDERDSYFVDEIKKDTKDTFGRRMRKWKLDKDDDELIRNKYKKR